MSMNFDEISRACLPAMEAAPERAAQILAAALGMRSTMSAAASARPASAPTPAPAPPNKYTPEEAREIRKLYADAVASKMTTAEFENYLVRRAAGLPGLKR